MLNNNFVLLHSEKHENDQVPKYFVDAWENCDPQKRHKWRNAISKEFSSMENRKVWNIIKKEDIPQDRRTVKCKCVFNIKRNGTYRARLVACGYSQVPGVDFTDNYAPVVHNGTFRIMLILKMMLKLDAKIIDVETAFLHGHLKEDIYMDMPDGLSHMKGNESLNKGEHCLHLKKTIYGLVQAAREWWRTLTSILKDIGFKGGEVDPCLFTYTGDIGMVIMAIYVDDCLCIGQSEAINHVIQQLKLNNLTVKIEEDMQDYLNCKIVFSRKGRKAWLGQPNLIKKLEAKFGPQVENLKKYATPGTPKMGIIRGFTPDVALNDDQQKIYRSGVGMLLYLVKHSRPDIANVTRELSKTMDRASMAGMKELKRVIKYALDTKNYGLKLEPKMSEEGPKWDMMMYCDSDYAGDKDTRLSVTGYVLYMCGAPVIWRSKSQRSVTLSSSEAEYVAMSEAVKEIRFIYQLLKSMDIEVELPIKVRIDNIGAIFMAENVTTNNRTKHVDVRYKYVREFIEDDFIKVIFVKSAENCADIFTKNVSQDLNKKRSEMMVGEETSVLSLD